VPALEEPQWVRQGRGIQEPVQLKEMAKWIKEKLFSWTGKRRCLSAIRGASALWGRPVQLFGRQTKMLRNKSTFAK
jgi:hypothetical protein